MTTLTSIPAHPAIHENLTEELKAEKAASLVLLPLFGTIAFYLLPESYQQQTLTQFLPQLLAYMGFAIWAWSNNQVCRRIGASTKKLADGIRTGSIVGLTLGMVNTGVILYIVPLLGMDITFLAQTPHAQVPTWLMLPWTIIAIAIVVEINFRGFLLGRLISSLASFRRDSQMTHRETTSVVHMLAILLSALVFAFDPFMVATFQHLHWIAIWDGIIWGWMWVRFHNLYSVITAHAVEVIVLYNVMKTALI